MSPDVIKFYGLRLPVKESLDKKLLCFLKNKSWYSSEVKTIVYEQTLRRGEALAIYAVLDKNDLTLNGIDHYAKYGSEYWQATVNSLSHRGYGVGQNELSNYGQSYIVGIDIPWESLHPDDLRSMTESIFENDIYNTCLALYMNVLPIQIASVEQC